MFRKLTALVLVTFLALPACALAEPTVNSVQALQSDGDTFCSAFSINEAEGLWMSAGHCGAHALDPDTKHVTIMGYPAYVVFMGFPAADIAVFQTEAHAPAVKLAKSAPKVGDAIYIVGYPYGITRTTTKGFIAAINIPIQHPSTDYYMTSDILDITTAGGNSGSPVFNAKGELVGVLWGGFTSSSHSLSVPWGSVVRATWAYFG